MEPSEGKMLDELRSFVENVAKEVVKSEIQQLNEKDVSKIINKIPCQDL